MQIITAAVTHICMKSDISDNRRNRQNKIGHLLTIQSVLLSNSIDTDKNLETRNYAKTCFTKLSIHSGAVVVKQNLNNLKANRFVNFIKKRIPTYTRHTHTHRERFVYYDQSYQVGGSRKKIRLSQKWGIIIIAKLQTVVVL